MAKSTLLISLSADTNASILKAHGRVYRVIKYLDGKMKLRSCRDGRDVYVALDSWDYEIVHYSGDNNA